MKTTIEINGYFIQVEQEGSTISVKAEKDEEVIEEFSIETEEGDDENGDDNGGDESGENTIKSFNDFDADEEDDFDDSEPANDDDDDDDDMPESPEADAPVEDETKLESFQSFINKKK